MAIIYKPIKFSDTAERELYLMNNPFFKKYLGKEVIETLILEGFCKAPASTRYHGAYEGGLFDHSVNVTNCLFSFTNKLGLLWSRPGSNIIVGMLHDLCKIDQYELSKETGRYVYIDTEVKGHGTKSVEYSKKIIDLTPEEEACILYHMGTFTGDIEDGVRSYVNAVHKYPNVLWTHTADMIASQIMEVQDES